jgi:hypothetical protein
MRGLETALYGFALFCELLAAGLIAFDIRENAQVRSAMLSKPAPLSDALVSSSGIIDRWARDKIRTDETDRSKKEAERLRGAISRQRLAFMALVLGAIVGFSANMLDLWVH